MYKSVKRFTAQNPDNLTITYHHLFITSAWLIDNEACCYWLHAIWPKPPKTVNSGRER